jgi:uncharacterized protein (DUF2236 family)
VLGPDQPLQLRRLWSEWPMLLLAAGRITALQATHPVVSAGIQEHSDIYADPLGRVAGTVGYALKILYGPDPAGAAAEVREMHRTIKGVMPGGDRYHAWNRQAWTWVHLSTFEGTLYGYRALRGEEPTRTELERMYAEVCAIGRAYGVQDRDVPPDYPAFRRYIDETIADGLEPTATLARTIGPPDSRPPPGLPGPRVLSGAAWRALSPATAHVNRVLLVGGFPVAVRERCGIAWSAADQAQYSAVVLWLRGLGAVLPRRVRTLPDARRWEAEHSGPRLR